jgi:transcriptional regulator with XRE-family HTH domain
MGWGQTYVAKIERGRVNIQLDTLDLIAGALHVGLSEIFENVLTTEQQGRMG